MHLSPSLRRKGLELAPGVELIASETPEGSWVAWIEQDGQPVMLEDDRPRLFEGPTCYQAQCAATRWLRGEDGSGSRRTRRARASG